MTVIPIVICELGTATKRIGIGNGGLGNKRMREDHLKYSIIKIAQNTEKSPGDLS